MIKIEVDEAYAYDMLSILHVKCTESWGDLRTENYLNLHSEISSQIPFHEDIVKSSEYKTLLNINKNIFKYIDQMKKNPSLEDGVWVDEQNYNRFLAKKALQEKFFPNQKITEQKLGYK